MTDAWSDRPDIEECRRVLGAARSAGHLGPEEPAAVFHDLTLLERRIDALATAFPPQSVHTVAIKANPVVGILAAAVSRGAGLEAASMEEVHLAIAAGCPSDLIVFDSPAKSVAELDEALRLGIRINVDNFDELSRLRQVLGSSTSIVGVRINPDVGDGAIGTTSVAGRASRFGIGFEAAIDQLPGLFDECEQLQALHVHVGSQGTTVDQLAAAAARVDEVRRAVERRCGFGRVAVVDIGGGLPTRYTSEDPPSLTEYVRELAALAPGLFDDNVSLVTEFGRSLQANCGWAASRVEYVKDTGGGPVAVIHLGADFLMRPAYQPEHWRHRFSPLEPTGAADASTTWTIAGPLCFAGDVVGRDVKLPALAPGDWLAIHDVGAYTLSMWSRHCNRGRPSVISYRTTPDISTQIVLARESSADVVQSWSPPA